jgi:hypothetical protein
LPSLSSENLVVMLLASSAVFFASTFAAHASVELAADGSACTVVPEPNGGDDAPSIITAFTNCSSDASVVFTNETYHIQSVMVTHGLRNVSVDMSGTLLVRAHRLEI